MRKHVATSLEAAGVLCASAAGFTINLGAGLGVLAVGLVLFGLAVERD